MPNTKEHLASTRWAGTLGVVLHVVSHWLSNFLCVHVFWVLLSPNYLCWPQWQCSYATHPGMPTPMPLILACLLLCHSSWHAYSYATHPGMPTRMPLILACLLLCHSSWHAYSYATHPGMPTMPLILACLLEPLATSQAHSALWHHTRGPQEEMSDC